MDFIAVRTTGYTLDQLEEAKNVRKDVAVNIGRCLVAYESLLHTVAGINPCLVSATNHLSVMLEQSKVLDRYFAQFMEINDTIYALEHPVPASNKDGVNE